MGELVGRQLVVDFDALCHDDVTRVVIRAPGADVAHFDEIVHRIGLNDVTYAVGYSAWLDLTPPGVSKASALEKLRETLGVNPAHTVAVGDGVFQLLPGQRPAAVLARDYISTFKLLSLYDIEQCWICAASARERGLNSATPWVVDGEWLEPEALRARLDDFNVILRF